MDNPFGRLRIGRKRLTRRLAAVVATTLTAGTLAAAPPAAAAAADLRVVTANMMFMKEPGFSADWANIGGQADVVFFQEVKYVRVANLLGPAWIVRQDTSTEAKAGSAVAIRRALVSEVTDFDVILGTSNTACDGENILPRWIVRMKVELTTGQGVRLASLHMPPPRCQTGSASPYRVMADNVVDFANRSEMLTILGGDWNKIVDSDPNDIGKRTGLRPQGPNDGARIDGFYTSPRIDLADSIRYLAKGRSDHRPVWLRVRLP